MKLLQYSDGGRTRVARVEDNGAVLPLAGVESTYQLARKAVNERRTLEQVAAAEAVEAPIAYAELLSEGRILPPLTHPDPSHCLVSGTGLTHLGSAAARDSMHAKIDKQDDALTDSMKMFKWGVEGGKPASGKSGVHERVFRSALQARRKVRGVLIQKNHVACIKYIINMIFEQFFF
jgi:hypothetical protein